MITKQIVGILFIVLVTTTSPAQVNTWSVGFELGTGLRWMQFDDTEMDNKPALSIANGLTIKYTMTENLALRSGINYEKKGKKAEITYTDEYGNAYGLCDAYTNLNYLTMPVLFQVTFGDRIKPYFFGGPYGGILVRAQGRVFIPDEDAKTYDIKEQYKDFDFGIATGAGVEIPLSDQFSVSAEFRGLIGLYDIAAYDTYSTTTAMTRTSNFMVGFMYNIPSSKVKK